MKRPTPRSSLPVTVKVKLMRQVLRRKVANSSCWEFLRKGDFCPQKPILIISMQAETFLGMEVESRTKKLQREIPISPEKGEHGKGSGLRK